MRRKAAFLDRDGVINVDRGYVHRPEDFEFVEGIFDLCRSLQARNYLLLVVTNQSGIARGLFSEQQFQALIQWMLARFRHQDVAIAQVYHCPHHPRYGVPGQRRCNCRKPAPGMLLKAIREHDIDPAESLMIGDRETDMQAAEAAGIRRRLLLSPEPMRKTVMKATKY